MNSKTIGSISEYKIMSRLLELGKCVLRPIEDNERFDIIVLDKETNTYQKIQCKTGRLLDGSVRFSTHNSYTPYMRPGTRRSYVDDVDCFIVYCPELDEYYLIPIDLIKEQGSFSLRVNTLSTSNTNNSRSDIKWAKNYVLA
jgi:hypothetical protein